MATAQFQEDSEQVLLLRRIVEERSGELAMQRERAEAAEEEREKRRAEVEALRSSIDRLREVKRRGILNFECNFS